MTFNSECECQIFETTTNTVAASGMCVVPTRDLFFPHKNRVKINHKSKASTIKTQGGH